MPNTGITENNANVLDNLRNRLVERVTNFANIRHTYKVNYARDLQNLLEAENRIPHRCTLVPFGSLAIDANQPGFDECVFVDFRHPDVNLEGRIVLELPIFPERGFVKMSCSFNEHGGNFLTIVTETSAEMYEVMMFCQSLLLVQTTDRTNGVYLERVHIPAFLQNSPILAFATLNRVQFEHTADNNNT